MRQPGWTRPAQFRRSALKRARQSARHRDSSCDAGRRSHHLQNRSTGAANQRPSSAALRRRSATSWAGQRAASWRSISSAPLSTHVSRTGRIPRPPRPSNSSRHQRTEASRPGGYIAGHCERVAGIAVRIEAPNRLPATRGQRPATGPTGQQRAEKTKVFRRQHPLAIQDLAKTQGERPSGRSSRGDGKMGHRSIAWLASRPVLPPGVDEARAGSAASADRLQRSGSTKVRPVPPPVFRLEDFRRNGSPYTQAMDSRAAVTSRTGTPDRFHPCHGPLLDWCRARSFPPKAHRRGGGGHRVGQLDNQQIFPLES